MIIFLALWKIQTLPAYVKLFIDCLNFNTYEKFPVRFSLIWALMLEKKEAWDLQIFDRVEKLKWVNKDSKDCDDNFSRFCLELGFSGRMLIKDRISFLDRWDHLKDGTKRII